MFSVGFLHYAEKCVSKEPDQSVTFFRKKVKFSKHIWFFIFFKCRFPDVKIHEECDSDEKIYAFGTPRLVKPEKPTFRVTLFQKNSHKNRKTRSIETAIVSKCWK